MPALHAVADVGRAARPDEHLYRGDAQAARGDPARGSPVTGTRDPLRVPLPGGGSYLTGRGDELVAIALELLWRADARARSGDLARLRRTFTEPFPPGGGSVTGTPPPSDAPGSAGFECVHAAGAAEVLGVSARMVRRMCEQGTLAAHKSAGRWQIERGEVLAHAAHRRAGDETHGVQRDRQGAASRSADRG
ncbi:helix-turn-helix domain-containing protein [Actinomadura opuntiae]|uniref:helix-turn-helix domain-containing protein n=1 Tax=Actinomadura sp. OS1-43 TaxID=604315 RepID=UPI003341F697